MSPSSTSVSNGVAANGESENSPSPEVVQGNGKSIYLQLELFFFHCDKGKRSLSNKVGIIKSLYILNTIETVATSIMADDSLENY